MADLRWRQHETDVLAPYPVIDGVKFKEWYEDVSGVRLNYYFEVPNESVVFEEIYKRTQDDYPWLDEEGLARVWPWQEAYNRAIDEGVLEEGNYLLHVWW